jgi:uncharacterized membrane protein YgcG
MTQFYNAMAEHLLLNRLCSFKVATKVVTSFLKPLKQFAMRTTILLLVLSVVIFTSCTSAYKTGQTPDDVYFSPPRAQDEYVKVKEKDQTKYKNYDQDEYYDDYYLRMKTHDRYRWSVLDDDYYYQRRYSSTYYNCWCANPWTPYTYWNYYYNPYGSKILVDPKSTVYSGPRISNLHTYNSTQLTNNTYSNPKVVRNNGINYFNQQPTFHNNSNGNNSAINSNTGNFLRNIFGGGGSSGSSGSSGNTTTTSSSSGSSGSSGGSAPVRKF